MSDDDDDDVRELSPKKMVWTEFDCPECSANNPCDDGFRGGDEIVCQYCGLPWRVRAQDDGRFKLQEP